MPTFTNHPSQSHHPGAAAHLAEAGFKFDTFAPEYGRYRLIKPCEQVIIRDTNTPDHPPVGPCPTDK